MLIHLNASSLIKQKVYVSKDEISFDQMDVKLKYVGFSIWDENENEIGIVQDYVDIKNNHLLIIEIDKQEVMIPVNETLIIKVMEKEKIIQLYIPEGLLNLNSESKTHKPFHFKQFKLNQEFAAMKIGTDGILLGAWANCQDCKYIVDVGTGTGVIALMLAQKNSNAIIDAVEIDHNAIKDAKRNFETSPWKKRLTLIHENFSKWNNKKSMI